MLPIMIWRSGILTTSNLAMSMDDVVALNVLSLFGPKGTHLNADIRVSIRASTIHHILFTAQSTPFVYSLLCIRDHTIFFYN